MDSRVITARKHGFSLVELSIVLVILGLLVGGVLSGQSLIRAAELRSVTEESQKFMSAINTFRDKYFAIPGDFNNATSFWTSLGGNGSNAACQNTPATGQATCNGNGDGNINNSAVAGDEAFRSWQHLANAGLIEGSYSGVGPLGFVPGTNVPAAKIGGGSIWRFDEPTSNTNQFPGSAGMFPGLYGNALYLQGWTSPNLTPAEEWNIDTKIDDGKPATGRVLGDKGASTTACTNLGGAAVDAAQDSDATYNLNNSAKACSYLYFLRVI